MDELKEAFSRLEPQIPPSIKLGGSDEFPSSDELKEAIFQTVIGGKDQWQEEGCAPNIRHKAALQQARDAAIRVGEGLEIRITSDLLSIDIQDCLDQLNVIVGVTTTEDVLDVIFEQFCLGK